VTVGSASSGRGGFALIGVLWIVVLLSLVGLDFSLRSRSMTRRVINAADYSVGLAAADAGVLYAEDRLRALLRRSQQLGLGSDPLPDPWQEPGRFLADTLELREGRAFVALSDAGTRLHLNRASESELRALMTALRIDAGDADRVAQAIMDWRDLDDFRRGRGAEREEYLRADAPTLPANGPFRSVGELRHVLGVTAELYERVAPYLTVMGSGRINLAAASPEVISALPGMSDELVSLIIRSRTGADRLPDLLSLTTGLDDRSRELIAANLASLLSRTTTETLEVLVHSEGWRAGSAAHVGVDAIAVRSSDAAFIVERTVR
jgi:general secretion pathway protein K